jgi:uncharacterized protein (TIGR00661 family)
MAKIVYGISGEGSGHSSRSREIMTNLQNSGHLVKAVSYGRGFENLKGDFDVFETEGLHISTADNKVEVIKTFKDNLSRFPDGVRKLNQLRECIFKQFSPDCIITDFEPMTAYLATHYDLPLVTIDNQHRMRYMDYPCPETLTKDAKITETIIRAIVPKPDVSLITTFYFGKVRNNRTFLFPPILRREVQDLTPSQGNKILVYFTHAYESFLEQLQRFSREDFIVYGTKHSGRRKNLTFRPFSQRKFLLDLKDSKAVIATAGFTLISEALHLKKPYLALPMQGQFEQELNAYLLEMLGYGKNGSDPSHDTVAAFLYNLSEYQQALVKYSSQSNTAICAHLERLLSDNCREAKVAHAKRR